MHAPTRPEASDPIILSGAYRKIGWRIVPFLMLAYVVAYIDRANIGMAKIQFQDSLNISEAAFGLGAGLFFAGYMLFEIPSNLLMQRIGARATLSRIMILWGVISASTAFVTTPTQFYVVRFLLGVAEAGFFPGVILYLSYWIAPARRGRVTSLFAMGGAIAGLIGAPLGGWLMSRLDTTHGLAGWQNLFIYEGLPAVLLGIAAWFWLADRPDDAHWLSGREKDLVKRQLELTPAKVGHVHSGMRAAFSDPKIYVAFGTWISVLAGTSTVAVWTPTILKSLGLKDVWLIGLAGGLPFLVALVAMYLVSRHSDRTQERRWHFAAALIAGGLSFVLLGVARDHAAISFGLLVVATAAFWVATPIFWTIPPSFLRGSAAAAGIAFVSSGGAIGGLISPVIIGAVATRTGSVTFGLAAVGLLILCAVLLFILGTAGGRLRPALATSAAADET